MGNRHLFALDSLFRASFVFKDLIRCFFVIFFFFRLVLSLYSLVKMNSSGLISTKRQGYLEWDEYFMGVAFLAAQRSKDPSTQVGACIVNDQLKIVGVGYNGFPIGCSDDELPWSKTGDDRLETKYPYVCHAELNAIVNKNSSDVRGCVMYVTLFPCNECAKLAIQAGIARVVYLSDKHHAKPEMAAARRLFDMVGIKYERFVAKRKSIIIDYEAGSREDMERSVLIEERNHLASPDGTLEDIVSLTTQFSGKEVVDDLATFSPTPSPSPAREAYALNALILAHATVADGATLEQLVVATGREEDVIRDSCQFLKDEKLLMENPDGHLEARFGKNRTSTPLMPATH